MSRGATPYALRGTPLVLPNGTVDNPAIRFGRDRSGLFRSGDGKVSLSLKRTRTIEFSEDGLAIFSQAASVVNPGDGNVTPLSLLRVNATTVDGQETRIDTHETIGGLVARQAVYRQDASKRGFKWYGRGASGLHTTPALTIDGDKKLTSGGNLVVVQPLIGDASFVLSPVEAGQDSQVRLASASGANGSFTLQGGPAAFGLGSLAGDVSLYSSPAGQLLLGTSGQQRMRIDPAGNTTFRMGPGGGFAVANNAGAHVFTVNENGISLGYAANSIDGGVAILDNSITSAKIKNGTILNDDIALGAIIGGSGGVGGSRIAPHTIYGAVDLQALSVTNAEIADNTITSAKIANGTLTEDDIAVNSVHGNRIRDGSITGAQILDGTITNAEIADFTITNNEIAAGAIHGNRITAGTITSTEIADQTINTAELAPGAIRDQLPTRYAGPPAPFNFTAVDTYIVINGLDTGYFNPPVADSWYECWASVPVLHSGGGRVKLNLNQTNSGGGVIAAYDSAPGACGSGGNSWTTHTVRGWFRGQAGNRIYVTAHSFDGGTVTIPGGFAQLNVMLWKR